MLTPSKKHIPQFCLFTGLADQLNQKHPLYQLSHKINWSVFENAFKVHYSETKGKPSKPIRLMVVLLIFKYVRNLSDENLIEQWSENIYYQYFSGEHHFRPSVPCFPTELVAFRDRIGEASVELQAPVVGSLPFIPNAVRFARESVGVETGTRCFIIICSCSAYIALRNGFVLNINKKPWHNLARF